MEKDKAPSYDFTGNYGSVGRLDLFVERRYNMSKIDDAVKQLVDAVKESDIYGEYTKQLSRVKEIPGLKEQIDEFRQRNFALQTSGDNAFDKLERLEEEYAEFRENPIVNDFLASELAFCRMMQDINLSITDAVDFE